ncbi:MAG: cytochrome c [Bacteroidia bacterium]
MRSYTLGGLILVGWFVVFRMFPAKREPSRNVSPPVSRLNRSSRPSVDDPLNQLEFQGKILFETSCQRCHRLDHAHNNLKNLRDRMPKGDWLKRFIRNAPQVIRDGDAYAQKIWEESSMATMDSFPNLTDREIAEMVMYIERYD